MKQLFVISFLLVCFQTFGQKPYVELILSPEKVEVNETFTVTVKSNIQGDINIDLPEHFVNGNNVMNRMEHEIDQVTGEVTTFMYYSRSGSMKKTGKFSFGPAYVRRGNKVFRSNMTQIHVSEVGSKKEDFAEHNILRKPACGIVVPSKTEVYVGEPLCLEAKVISKFSPTHYESYESYKLKPIAETHELNHNQQVTVRLEGIGRHQRFVFEHDKKLLFPQVAGKLTIESFELMLQSGFDSYPVTSSPIAIRVNPLPPGAPKSFNGAVGDFSIEAKTIKWCGKEGDIIPYEVVLKGTGNIHDVEITKPKLPKGFSYYGDPEVKEKINFTEKGASGEINCLFYIQAHEIGVFESPDFDFSYFDLKSKKYISIQTHSVEWKVLSDPNKQIDGENKKAPLVVESYDSPKNNTANVASTAWMKWIGYSTSAVLAFLLIFGFAKRKSS
ncbi:MAG: BatD family protein, partial [Bacteroidetes bacterium]|nr:BatD family protein [Bacteroidota bacterium]